MRTAQGKANPVPWEDEPGAEQEPLADPGAGETPESLQTGIVPDEDSANSVSSGCSSHLSLINGKFDFGLTGGPSNPISIIADNYHCAIFIDDSKSASIISGFQENLKSKNDSTQTSSSKTDKGRGNSVFHEPLLGRLKNKPDQTLVILTEKSRTSNKIASFAQKLLSVMVQQLNFPDYDRRLINSAGSVYFQIKYQRFESAPASQNSKTDVILLDRFTTEPEIQSVLGLLYSCLEESPDQPLTTQLKAANVLTAVDLLVDNFDLDDTSVPVQIEVIKSEFMQLKGKLITAQVADAMLQVIESELPNSNGPVEFNHVLIYSDKVKGLFALQSRLRHDNFVVTSTGSPEEFVAEHKRKPPNMVILHFTSNPTTVIKALHQFLNKGLAIGSVPAFVLVKDTAVGRLTPLLDMGVEEILDLDSQLDILIHKMKKVRTLMEEALKSKGSGITTMSTSQGDLSHMGIIDLLQALGPGRRTTCITISQPENAAESFVMYLDQGKIVYAKIGSVIAEEAIYEAMKWERGHWKVEPIKEENLPEANVSLGNEAILMEGCRLLDEQNR